MMHIEPNLMYKLGVTTMRDAAKRLSPETARLRGFRGVALGSDYYINPMWSIYVPVETAKKLEESFKIIKKNVWTRIQYNGTTECRYFTQGEVNELLASLRKRFPKHIYGVCKRGYIKVYFDELTKIKPTTQYDQEFETQMEKSSNRHKEHNQVDASNLQRS